MFFSPDDDEQDFMSPGGSKLASLFGIDKANGQGGNASLTYTAPKQPKKKDTSLEGTAAPPTVVVAGVVHAYKYVDKKYMSLGKLGVALLLTQSTKDYRLLLYMNKQQQITNAKITSAFTFNIQQNNYASFYDDARQMWSIIFDNAEAIEKFAKEVALAKASSGIQTELVQQDLSLGEGGALENGDSAEVKYTGWLLTNGTFGNIFDQSPGENNFRFKVGKGKVIKGWDQGMLGMKKGGKRLLIVPPALAYGSQGVNERIPPNSTLIFEVLVVRVKLQKGESSQDTNAPPPLPSLGSELDNDEMDDPGVKGRSRSISEHLSQSPDSGKAKLISRMARMGQPMLPFQGAIPAQPDDSDEDLNSQMQASVKPPLPTKPRTSSVTNLTNPVGQIIISQAQPAYMNPGYTVSSGQPMVVSSTGDMLQQQQPAFLQNLPGAQQMAVYQNPNTFLQQQQAILLQQQQQQQQQQQHLLQQQLLSQGLPTNVGVSSFGVPPTPISQSQPQNPSSSSADALAPVLLTETRQQNTEVRIGISKMADKIDKILEKVDHLNAAGLGAQGQGMMIPYSANLPAPSMEANVLMQNVSRIVQENERLKKEVYEQSNKVQEQNDKIAALLEKNQKYVEQSQNLLEQRNEGYKSTASQSQAKVLALEQEKVYLATELSSSSAQITTLQLELGEYRKREGELKQQLQMTSTTSSSTREELERLRAQREEDEQKISGLTASIRDEKLTRKTLEAKLSSHQEELLEIKSAKETLEKILNDRKRKAAEERRQLEEDLEDAKNNYEKTIEDLRERLRKQKTSVDTDTQNKMSRIEEEISSEWQAKSDRMLAAAAEKYSRQISDLHDEKEDLARKVAELEKKLSAVRSSGSYTEQQVTQLQDELSEMKLLKDKYENIRMQSAAMKERYERRIKELEEELEEEESSKSEVVEKAKELHQDQQRKIQQLQQEVQSLQTRLSAGTDVQQTSSQSVTPNPDLTSSYENIRMQSAAMKERYERRIKELEEELEEEESSKSEVVEKAKELHQDQQRKIQQLQQEVQSLQTRLSAGTDVQQTSSQSVTPNPDLTSSVKRIMNSVYQGLRSEFIPDGTYLGSEVLATMLGVIKQTTLKLVSEQENQDEEEEEDEEEEDKDEEEENEEEEEEITDEEEEEEDEVDKGEEYEDEEEEDKEEEIHTEKRKAETRVDEQRGIEAAVKKAADEKPSVSLTEGKEPPTKQQVQENTQAKLAGHKPQAFSSVSDSSISNSRPLPSLRSDIKNKDVTKKQVTEGSRNVASSDEEGLSSDDEVHPEEASKKAPDNKSQNYYETDSSKSAGERVDPDLEKAQKPQITDDTDASFLVGDTTLVLEKVSDVEKSPAAAAPEGFASVSEEFTPSSEDVSPASVSYAAVSESLTPASQYFAPASEDLAPASQGFTAPPEALSSADASSVEASESSVTKPENQKEEQASEQTKQALLEASVIAAPKPVSDLREPPPLFDDDDDDDSPLFGNDSVVSETLGSAFKPKPTASENHVDVKPAVKSSPSALKEKTTPGKKLDLVNDEDLKPQPPPPLFGDDSDDDLDWLS